MMKIITTLCLVLLSVHSYSQEIIPEVETVARNSLMYHQDTNELVTGTVEGFHENGQLEYRRDYKDGEQVGLYEIFHENGQLESRGNVKNGNMEGLWEWFNEDGQIKKRGSYKDGKPHGLWEYFDENGNLTKTEEYKDGELIE